MSTTPLPTPTPRSGRRGSSPSNSIPVRDVSSCVIILSRELIRWRSERQQNRISKRDLKEDQKEDLNEKNRREVEGMSKGSFTRRQFIHMGSSALAAGVAVNAAAKNAAVATGVRASHSQ